MAAQQNTRLRLIKEVPLRQIAREAVADYRARYTIAAAEGRVRCIAVAGGHQLDAFRRDAVHLDRAHAFCRLCCAGAEIDLGTAEESISESLAAPCSGGRR